MAFHENSSKLSVSISPKTTAFASPKNRSKNGRLTTPGCPLYTAVVVCVRMETCMLKGGALKNSGAEALGTARGSAQAINEGLIRNA